MVWLHYLWLAPLGLLVGAFGTLIGAGGGFVLVPILLIAYPKEQPELITSISLAVVFFNALSGSWAYTRMGRVNYRAGLLFSAAGIPGAVLGALTVYYIPRRAFDAVFGLLMVGMAIYLLFHPENPEGKSGNGDAIPAHRISFNSWLGSGLSVGVGYVSSLLGIGGGIIHVPILVRVLGFPVHYATATSHFILAILALAGTSVHVATGSFHHGFRRTILLSIGVIIGAQLGAALSRRLHGSWIIRGLAIALVFVGVRILILAFSGR